MTTYTLTITFEAVHDALDLLVDLQADGHNVTVTRSAHAPSTKVIDEIIDYERETASAKRAWREDRKARDILDYNDYLTIGCPTCHAGFDRPCHTVHGNPLKPFQVHSLRRAAYNDHDEVWGTPEAVPVVPKMCKCGHDDVVHFVTFDGRDQHCTIEACSCSDFTAVQPIWVAKAITLDEM